ncbi:MAG: hypothetical protein ABJ056_10245 [Halioglobus sp.]
MLDLKVEIQTSVCASSLCYHLLMALYTKLTRVPRWLWGIALLILANVPLFSPIRAPKWDAFDEMWSYFRWLGSSSRQGYFPDFFPNVLSGYPIGSNIQAGTYNIVYLLAAYIFPDSVVSIKLIYLFSQFAILLLCYALGRSFLLDSFSSFYLGLAITASGFVIGHASHFSYLATAIGLLGGLLSIRLALENKSTLAYLVALSSVYYMATAGYPANIIFGGQCLLIYWVYLYFTADDQRKPLLWVALGVTTGLILSAPSIWHFVNLLLLSDRGAGLTVDEVLAGSLPSYSLLNFVFPIWHMRFFEPTMERFHLLFLATPLILSALYFGILRVRIGFIALILFLAVIVTMLSLGSNSPLPIRGWLAENLFIYRAGRFPSGEHRGVALFLLALVSAFGLQWFTSAWPASKKWLMALVVIDFLVVMYGLENMRISKYPENSWGTVAMYKAEFLREEQSIIDAPRDCTADGEIATFTAISRQLEIAPEKFYWNAYTSLRVEGYDEERDIAKRFICGPSRLWDYDKEEPYQYSLAIYSPGYIKFRLVGDGASHATRLIWADVNDGFWKLRINGERAEFIPTIASLRMFIAEPGDDIEMIYEGPLSRIWR